jgi:NADPH-ferrihemoprotein reductase
MVVFWGTQSGTAKILAKSLAREASARFNIKSMAADLEDYDHLHLAEFPATKVAVFVTATYGEGDPPDNAQDFCNVLDQLRCSPQKALENMSYAAFGLGNRNYAQFNKVVDVVDESFQALGAKRLVIVGKGDESTGSTEIEFSAWKMSLFEVLRQFFGAKENSTLLYVPDVQVTENSNARPTMVYRGEPNKNHLIGHFHVPVTRSNPHIAPVASSRQLFESSTRHCVHMEFNIAGFPSQQMAYETGDHVGVWPSNPSVEVERVLTVVGSEMKDDVIDIVSLEGEGRPVPNPTTRHALLRYYLEICGSPTRDTVSLLAQFAPSNNAAEALFELTSSSTKFKTQVTDRYLTLAQVSSIC